MHSRPLRQVSTSGTRIASVRTSPRVGFDDSRTVLETGLDQFVVSSSDPNSSANFERGLNSVLPHEPHPSRLPIGTIRSFDSLRAAYTAPHSLQAAIKCDSPFLSAISSESSDICKKYTVSTAGVTVLFVATVTTADRSIVTQADRQVSGELSRSVRVPSVPYFGCYCRETLTPAILSYYREWTNISYAYGFRCEN